MVEYIPGIYRLSTMVSLREKPYQPWCLWAVDTKVRFAASFFFFPARPDLNIYTAGGHWLTQSYQKRLCRGQNQTSILDHGSKLLVSPLSSLLAKRITWVSVLYITWRVSWAYVRWKPLANILATSISRLLLPVHTVPVSSTINQAYRHTVLGLDSHFGGELLVR